MSSDTETVVLHRGVDEMQDVWAVFMPSVKKFVYEDGAPYGFGNAIEYHWGDDRVGLELKIRVWRNSAGINAERVP